MPPITHIIIQAMANMRLKMTYTSGIKNMVTKMTNNPMKNECHLFTSRSMIKIAIQVSTKSMLSLCYVLCQKNKVLTCDGAANSHILFH